MTGDSQTYVIVGAGHASAQLCESLRRGGFAGRIILIGEETWLPYQRPPLSKAYLLGDFARERLFVKPQSFYDENDIELRLGAPVTAINRGEQTVSVNEEALRYDRLALLTGTRVRRLDCPGAHLNGVHYVRGIDDMLRKKGLEVTILHRSPRLLSRVASAETAAFMQKLHEDEGVHIRLNQTVRSIEGAGKVEQVEIERVIVDHVEYTKRVEIPADLVVAGIGVLPNQRLASDAGLPTEDGIVVDAFCRTEDPNIFAAGDVNVAVGVGSERIGSGKGLRCRDA